MKKKLLLFSLLLVSFWVKAQIQPSNNILYVNKAVNGGNASGSSWSNAIPELANALVYAKNNQGNWTASNPLQIWVAQGTYKPLYSPADNNFGTNQGRDNAFLMVKNVQVYGGFAGNEMSLSARNVSANTTLLSADRGTVNDASDNCFHVMVSSGDVGTARLDGFTLERARSYQEPPEGQATITVNNRLIARPFGGGIISIQSNSQLNNLIVRNNNVFYSGGGIYIGQSSEGNTNAALLPTITNSIMTGNNAVYGGALSVDYFYNGNVILRNCLINNNTASFGGAMDIFSGRVDLLNSTVIANTTNGENPQRDIEVSGPNNPEANIRNSIFYGSTSTSQPGNLNRQNSLVQGFNGGSNGNLNGNINASQVFINAPGGDYRLRSGSPVIDQGNNQLYTNAGGNLQNDRDLSGSQRLEGQTIDVGAYERKSITPNNNIIYVDINAVNTNGSGSSWNNAVMRLSDALVYAKNNQSNWTASNPLQIWVAQGTYRPLYSPADNNFGTNQGRDNAFLMVNNVQVYGGFNATETSLNQRNFGQFPTILSGNIGDLSSNTDNTYHVVVSTGNVGVSRLDGFTVRDGYGIGGTNSTIPVNGIGVERRAGGGFFNRNSSPFLVNLKFLANNSEFGGGMYYRDTNSFLTALNVSFTQNNASNVGGAIRIYNANLNLINSTVANNNSNNGGAIHNLQNNGMTSGINIRNTVILGNTSSNNDAGIIEGNANLIRSFSLIQGYNDTNDGNLNASAINPNDVFFDAANGIFRLKQGSPLINQGSNSVYTNAGGNLQNDKDLSGGGRLANSTIDIGAYERAVITPSGNNVIYVDVNVANSSTESGSSWANALPQLSDALVYAKNNQSNWTSSNPLQIWVAQGSYRPLYSPADNNFGTNQGRDNAFLMVNNVQVYGGFNATETNIVQRNFAAYPTILSGNIGDPSSNTDNTYHVVVSTGNVGVARLDGFTVRDGYQTGNNQSGFNVNGTNVIRVAGAGFYVWSSAPALVNLRVNNNISDFGGAMYYRDNGSTLIARNVNFTQNSAGTGGAVRMSNANLNFVNSTIAGNTANSGGAIAITGGNNNSSILSLSNTILLGNTANNDSPGINAGGATLNLNNSLVQGYTNTNNGNLNASGISPANVFTSPSTGDFSLKPNSPVINRGRNQLYTNAGGNLQNDRALGGSKRLSGSTIDMGSYEFTGFEYIYENGSWSPEDPSGVSTADDNVTVINGTTSLTANTTVKNLSVNPSGTLYIRQVLNLNGNMTNNGRLIFASDANANGQLGPVPASSSINGNVTVQRYMRPFRSYRMLTSAVNSITTIHQDWQEGAADYTANPAPGFGTHITGWDLGQNLGFDYTPSGNPGLYTLDVPNQQFAAVPNTNNTSLEAGKPYLLFVRGDRSIDVTSNQAVPTNTTLRATGSLLTGTITKTFPSSNGDFVMMANPYQATVNLNEVKNNAGTQNLNFNQYYVYDPSLGDFGGYATVELPSGFVPASSSTANQYLQPGMSAQIKATGNATVVFQENDKATGNLTNAPFNLTPLQDAAHIVARLHTTVGYANGDKEYDSFGLFFAPDFNNAQTPKDAVKPVNFGENMGIAKDSLDLSVERRQKPEVGEQVQLGIYGFNHTQYTLILRLKDMENRSVYFDDNFTGESTELESGLNEIEFNLSDDQASRARDRFSLRFEETSLGTDLPEEVNGISLYPNPVVGKSFYLEGRQLNGNLVQVQLNDMQGRRVYERKLRADGSRLKIELPGNFSTGVYSVKISTNQLTKTFKIIKK